jgi:chromosomal replication initiation ATPase DnaA
LPDLKSRLAATPQVAIQAPDDALLAAVMAKQFRDRGLTVAPDVLAYVMTRIERSFAEVAEVVDRLDNAALAAGRGVTIPLAREVLAEQLDWLDPMAVAGCGETP